MSQEIEKQGSSALVVPDFLKGVSGNEGLENVGKEDIILPRLSICQSLSPQRKKSSPLFIEGLEEGHLFNTVTKDIYGNSVRIIPILYSKSRIYFRDLKEGGGILCQSLNGINGGSISPTCDTCPNSQWGTDGKERTAPACDIFMNVVSLLLRPDKTTELIILSFKSSELKAARSWVTLMQARKKPTFAQVYDIKTVEVQSAKGPYFTRNINWVSFVPDPELYKYAEKIYDDLRGRVITPDVEEDQKEQEPGDEPIPF